MTYGSKFSRGASTPPSWRTQLRGRIDSGGDLPEAMKRGRMSSQGALPGVFVPVVGTEVAASVGAAVDDMVESMGAAWLASDAAPAAPQRRPAQAPMSSVAPVIVDEPVPLVYARQRPGTWGMDESNEAAYRQLAELQRQQDQWRLDQAQQEAQREADEQANAIKERRRRAQHEQDQADWGALQAALLAPTEERQRQSQELHDRLLVERAKTVLDADNQARAQATRKQAERRQAEEAAAWDDIKARVSGRATEIAATQGAGVARSWLAEMSAAFGYRFEVQAWPEQRSEGEGP